MIHMSRRTQDKAIGSFQLVSTIGLVVGTLEGMLGTRYLSGFNPDSSMETLHR